MYDAIIILGPTATGKTNLAINIAKQLNTEIINADSMYIYNKLNIGTAKPTDEELRIVKHHLVGFVDPTENFNVSEYRNRAIPIIQELLSKNKIPVIVGGTGFYIDSLITNYSYGEFSDNQIRGELQRDLDKFGIEYLFNKLTTLDYETSKKLHINDKFRILRALEICMSSGRKKSEITNLSEPVLKKPLLIGLNIPRDILYDRINKRVDIMFEQGLIDEVKELFNHGLTPETSQAMKGIGYKEIIEYLNGNCTLEFAIEKIKQHTRNYAKRQITWFRRNEDIIWFNPLEETNLTEKVLDLYKKSLKQ